MIEDEIKYLWRVVVLLAFVLVLNTYEFVLVGGRLTALEDRLGVADVDNDDEGGEP